MDLIKMIIPTWRERFTYKADNNLESAVNANFYNLEDETLLVIATEISSNTGPSITNSIEAFARKVKTYFPTFKNYKFIESYRWAGEPVTYDLVTFLDDENCEDPTWRRLDEEDLQKIADEVNSRIIE